MHCEPGHSLHSCPQWLTASQQRVSELAPASVWPVGLREGYKSVIHLPFLLWRLFPQTLVPLAHFPRLANLSNCCFCVGSWCTLVLYKRWDLPAPSLPCPHTFQISLVPSPIHLQGPVWWGFIFWEQIPRAKYTEFLSIYPLPTPFFSLLLMGWDGRKGLHPDRSWLCPFTPLNVVFSYSQGIDGLFYSPQVIFRVSRIRRSCSLVCMCEEVIPVTSSSTVFLFSPHVLHLNNLCSYSV